jgi:hypothetical protein
MHKILLQVHVEISEDFTVKKARGISQLYTNQAILQTPFMSRNMCTVTAKKKNIPGNVPSSVDGDPSSPQAKHHY